MSGNLIIFATYWNDMDWLKASLEYIDYWKPDKLYLCEGCFDKKYPARSTDGTYEYLKEWRKNRDNVWIVENPQLKDYFSNQVSVCNLILQLSKIEAGDWILRIDCDHFMFKNHVDQYKKLMETTNFDYPIHDVWNFWDDIKRYYSKCNDNGLYLPYKYTKGAAIIPVCHLAMGGKLYKDSGLKALKVKLPGFHYYGLRNKKRMEDKYNVGTRQSPKDWKGGIQLKNRQPYDGPHPEFAIPVLKEKGFVND